MGFATNFVLQETEGHALPTVAVTMLRRNWMRAQRICSPQILSPIGTYNLMTEFSTKITPLNNDIVSSECLYY